MRAMVTLLVGLLYQLHWVTLAVHFSKLKKKNKMVDNLTRQNVNCLS